jgi:protease IV
MKQFFKFMFASILGTIITFILIFIMFMGLVASIASFTEEEAIRVEPNSVLHVKLNNPISDRTQNNPLENFNFQTFETINPIGLNDILKNLEKAAKDQNIKGIYLDLSFIPAGIASIEEIRNALLVFKESGKFLVCYANSFSQTAYYVATAADEIYMNPEGAIFFKGLVAEVMFLKGTLDKLDIDMQIIRAGKYKSAIETFTREDFSSANREQMDALLKTIWAQISGTIAESRGIDIYDLNLIANNLEVSDAMSAYENKFIDGLKYKEEVLEMLREKLSLGAEDKMNSVSIEKYTHSKITQEKKPFTRDRIAVIYATGQIMMGEGSESVIGAKKLSQAIRKARKDKNVKAIVMRVNSPGGDVLASEIIWHEAKLASDAKPFIVSMGDVAASGGYWISTHADKILADRVTITGSIGVYGMFPNLKKFYNEWLGITFDRAKTNDNADFMSINKPLSDYQAKVIEREIDGVYKTFLQRVAEGRNLSVAQVDSIAQGRVWSGTDAKRIGLIDEFGGLQRSINVAAEMAELSNYRIKELPEFVDPFEELLNNIMGKPSASYMQNELGKYYEYLKYVKSISETSGIQAKMPYKIVIE